VATFTPTTRTKKEYNTVYIRISHRKKPDYIKTDMVVDKSRIRKGKIIDSEILAHCSIIIKEYYDKIKNIDISQSFLNPIGLRGLFCSLC